MFCTQCGQSHQDTDKFCSRCGHQVAPVDIVAFQAWWETIEDVVTHRASFTTFINTLLGFLTDTSVAKNPMGEAAALSRRIVWCFADDTVLWLGFSGEIFVSHLTKEFTPHSDPPEFSGVESRHFRYSFESNGWIYAGPRGVVALVNSIAHTHGHPTLILPWLTVAQTMLAIDDGLWGIYDEGEDEAQTERIFNAIIALFTALTNGSLTLPGGNWGFRVAGGTECMPRFSRAGRFSAFLDALDDKGWLVLRDQCCQTCATETIKHESTEENQSAFVTWEQNAGESWAVSGAIDQTHMVTQAEHQFLTSLAASFGLIVTEPDHVGPGERLLAFG
jgi:hypothetical protein